MCSSDLDADDDVAKRNTFALRGSKRARMHGTARRARARRIGGRLKKGEAQHVGRAALLQMLQVELGDLTIVDERDDGLASARRTRVAQRTRNECAQFGSSDADPALPTAHDAHARARATAHPRAARAAVTFPERTLPSTRPLVFGPSQPITFPISFADVAPVAAIASATNVSMSLSLNCAGR